MKVKKLRRSAYKLLKNKNKCTTRENRVIKKFKRYFIKNQSVKCGFK
jgi:hypothetical protein